MDFAPKVMPRWIKQSIAIGGLLWGAFGLFVGFFFLCFALILILENEPEAVQVALAGLVFVALTVGAGSSAFWHGLASLQGKSSGLVRVPSTRRMIAILIFLVLAGGIIFQSALAKRLISPAMILIAAAVPSLLALVWLSKQGIENLSWRRSVVAFAGGATFSAGSVLLSLIALIIITAIAIAIPVEAMLNGFASIFGTVTRVEVLIAPVNQSFYHGVVQFTIIVPLIGALVKPLVTLPLLGQLSRREAFLIGAIAGAGFAAMENLLYFGFGFHNWGWIWMIQLAGGAIHPVGAGLVTLGWQNILMKKSNAWPKWMAYFGMATALHMLWNLGLLLAISERGSIVFNNLFSMSPSADILTFIVLVILIGVGCITLLLGRLIAQQQTILVGTEQDGLSWRPAPAIAVWALASLFAILPLGIIGLRILVNN